MFTIECTETASCTLVLQVVRHAWCGIAALHGNGRLRGSATDIPTYCINEQDCPSTQAQSTGGYSSKTDQAS